MHVAKLSKYRSRTFLARPLIVAVLLLQAAHILALLFLPHRLLISNLLQVILPFLLVAISLHQSLSTNTWVGRRCWLAVAAAFGSWGLGQVFFVYLLYHPSKTVSLLRPDEALWVVFGLPLLLAVNTTHDEVDMVGWFDRGQAVLFFAVLYLLVFLPDVGLNLQTADLIQDLALLLCCVLRLPICTLSRERRFFVRLAFFLLLYGPLTMVGDTMRLHGWPTGTLSDLVWTVPMSCLALLILADALRYEHVEWSGVRFVKAVRGMQGLGVAALAFMSIAVCALLALYRPLMGSAFLVVSFGLFALRTNARERAWHRTHGQLEETALQDTLTGLGNRTMLRNALQEQLHVGGSRKTTTALVFADLDGFKKINDSLGHSRGDQLLVKVAERLRNAAPDGAVICRHGGDEFVLLISAADADEVHACAEDLLAALRPAYHLNGHILPCTASIGVVLANPGESADDLLRTADHAMYRAKQLGKDRVQVFDAELRAQMSSRWQMEADLRVTLDQGKIGVAFQPILSVEGGEISGFEALARWWHPNHGSVPPAEFIPLAEESGLILQLGSQIFEKACLQVAGWNRAWGKNLSLSVNVSPHQFADSNLIPKMLDMLETAGLPPKLLRLEITESALLVNEGLVKQTLLQARTHGIRISLDDFGTGYSSLAFLLRLPVDEVKVDRSFVSDMQSDPQRKELVRTVVHLGQSLGKRVVAEGVETEQDLRDLAAMGCECAQGWLISRPLPADVLEADMPSITARNIRSAQSAAAVGRHRSTPAHRSGSQTSAAHPYDEALEPTP